MTSTLERPPSANGRKVHSESQPRLPLIPTGRKPLMIALSALLVFGSIAGFATAYSSGLHKESVLMVTQDIQKGQPITAGDLGSVSASISGGVHPIPVSEAAILSGRRAAVTVPAGSLLTMADTTAAPPIAHGDAVVGIALKVGQLPSNGVEPGDQVMIVETGALGSPTVSVATGSASQSTEPSSGNSGGVLDARASVFEVESAVSTGLSSSNGGTASGSAAGAELVSVEVPDSIAPEVSGAAAAGQVTLVLLPDQPSGDAHNSRSSRSGGSGTGSS